MRYEDPIIEQQMNYCMVDTEIKKYHLISYQNPPPTKQNPPPTKWMILGDWIEK